MILKGSEIILECLLEQGVDTVFGFPGGAVIPLYDSMYDYRDKIRHILTCHEQGATHAADGYARSTGKTGVVFATSGPGATNTVTGIANAFLDSVPLVVITGQVGNDYIGKDSFQEIDITSVTLPITKHNFLVKRVEDLASTVRRAFEIASGGRPGPVLIDVPKDVFTSEFEFTRGEKDFESQEEEFLDLDLVNEFLTYIEDSKKPLIYAGGGIITSGTAKELKNFAKKMAIPVVNSLMAQGCMDSEDELSLGHVGMHGHRVSNYAVSNCDLLITLGARFSDRVASHVDSFASKAKIIQIDIDDSEIGKNKEVDFSICSDLKDVMPILSKNSKEKSHDEWLAELRAQRDPNGDEQAWNERNILRKIKSIVGKDAIVATDVGQHQMWVSQYFGFSEPRKLLTSAGLGTMGFGMGAAIGAKIGNPNERVVLVTGDGSFRMNLNELATVNKYDIPLIVVVMNNSTLGMVRQWQAIFQDKKYSETDITDNIDYPKLAQAFRINGVRADNFNDLEQALKTAVENNEPLLLEVVIEKDSMVFPMVPAGGTYDDMIYG